jgi:hypothetical protein
MDSKNTITLMHFSIATSGVLGGPLATIEGSELNLELVRNSTLASSSHNAQCGKFKMEDNAISSRQCTRGDYDGTAITAQMADVAFIKELKAWIRFNGPQAVHTRDGLFSVASGNPSIPTWLVELAFGMVFRPQIENDKCGRQIRSSSGVAVFVGQAADRAHWVDVGGCCQHFALQATALGIRNAFLNQPVEVASKRPVQAVLA